MSRTGPSPLPATDARVLVIAPHMDDETLGCGQLMASLADSGAIHVLFATDGAGSPSVPEGMADEVDIPEIRRAEARAALSVFGVPDTRIEFLDLPDGRLARHADVLLQALDETFRRMAPTHVFVPFRYDRHPDHLAVHVAVTRHAIATTVPVFEYFVYARWKLLRTGDVRDYLPSEGLWQLDDAGFAARKRAALACHASQTTCYFEGQRRPVLTPSLVDAVCGEPERFLLHDPARPGRLGLARGRLWIPLAHTLEPTLKLWKDRLTGAGL